MLFSAYRRDDFADPEGFVAQLGVILCQYPEEVVTYITSPLTGIQRRSKWPPTISEVVDACMDHVEHLDRLKKPRVVFRAIAAPLLRDLPQGTLANIFVPENHYRYAGLVDWAKTAEIPYWQFGVSSDARKGIWVNIDVWEHPPARKQPAPEETSIT